MFDERRHSDLPSLPTCRDLSKGAWRGWEATGESEVGVLVGMEEEDGYPPTHVLLFEVQFGSPAILGLCWVWWWWWWRWWWWVKIRRCLAILFFLASFVADGPSRTNLSPSNPPPEPAPPENPMHGAREGSEKPLFPYAGELYGGGGDDQLMLLGSIMAAALL